MHDLRLALRESTKKLEDADGQTLKLRKDYDDQLRKKDEVISMKESIIKEKDAYIIKLEQELCQHDPNFVPSTGLPEVSSGRPSTLEVPSSTKQQRTKRTAISAEPAQLKKSKDLRVVLQAFDKSDR